MKQVSDIFNYPQLQMIFFTQQNEDNLINQPNLMTFGFPWEKNNRKVNIS